MRRLRRRVPLTPLGWTVVVVVIGVGVAAAITGSGTLAIIAAAVVALVLLLAAGAPRNVQDLEIPPTRFGPPLIPPRDDDPDS
jgi:hypothetical protein